MRSSSSLPASNSPKKLPATPDDRARYDDYSPASPTAAALATHIDGPCGTVFADQPSRATNPTAAVNSGAAIAASNHTSAPKHPVSAPRPRASLTSPAPAAVGA